VGFSGLEASVESVGGSAVLQECYKSVTRMVRECYKSVTRVLQEWYKSVSGVLHNCYKSFTRVLQECYLLCSLFMSRRVVRGPYTSVPSLRCKVCVCVCVCV
jgi:hypothetical protein